MTRIGLVAAASPVVTAAPSPPVPTVAGRRGQLRPDDGTDRLATMPGVLTGRIGMSPAMIGRAGVLQRLRSLIEEADAHYSDLPTVALVAGEAGIGKTRLVRAVLDEIAADPTSEVVVLAGAAEPGSLSRSYDLVAQLAPPGSLQPAVDALTLIAETSRPVVGDSTSEGRTVVVVVEDLHWVDAESASFIDELARRPLPNVVIVGTYRPGDLRRGSPGGDLVSRLERRNEVEQIRLDRLARHEVGAMMAAIADAPVSSGALEAVSRRSAGVPFVVEELMRFIGPDTCSGDVFDVQLPWSLEEAVRQQLAGLATVERTIVDALAVLAEPAGFEVLVAVSALSEAEVLDGLRELMARGVVVEPREDRLWFGHALVADSVLHELLGRERRRLHGRCFATLQELTPDDHAALARHALGAGRYDEIASIACRGARQYLDRGASFQALRLACEGLAEDGDELELLSVATEAAWRLDFQSEALDHAQRWLELATVERDRIDARRYVGRLMLELGDVAGAVAMVEHLVADAARYEAEHLVAEQARAEAAVAQLLMLRHDSAAIEWADRAIVHARTAGDRGVEVQAQVERASSLQTRTNREEVLVALQDAADSAALLGDGVSRARAINNMMDLLPPAAAETAALRSELHDTAAAVGLDKLGGANVVWWDAVAAEAEGDLAEFRRLIDMCFVGQSGRLGSARDHESVRIAIEEGRLADAHAALPDLAVVEVGCSDPRSIAALAIPLALAGLERDLAAARSVWELMCAGDLFPDGWGVSWLIADSVASALAAGIPPNEVRMVFDSRLLAGHPSASRIEMMSEGFLLVAEHRHDEAVVALRLALETADQHVTRAVQGLMEIALAQSLLATGDRVGARRAAEAAVTSLSRWPGWRRDRAEALAARLESSTVRTNGELTARESEVAALIAEGLTNGQLAERLFISPKTASVHVSNILAKLGLSTRAEIAAWQIRRGLLAAG